LAEKLQQFFEQKKARGSFKVNVNSDRAREDLHMQNREKILYALVNSLSTVCYAWRI